MKTAILSTVIFLLMVSLATATECDFYGAYPTVECPNCKIFYPDSTVEYTGSGGSMTSVIPSDVRANTTIIYWYNETSGSYQSYIPGVGGDLTGLVTGECYKWSVNATTSWGVVPDASIVAVDWQPIMVGVDTIVKIKIYVKNTGSIAYDFPVGLTIGENLNVTGRYFPAKYCNRDCYADGLGDYGHTGTIGAGDMVIVERDFKFRSDMFEDGHTYDMIVDVFTGEYLSPWYALDWHGYVGAFYMQPPFAYGYYAIADQNVTHRGDTLAITGWVYNNGTRGVNFSLGMSIGKWDTTQHGRIYTIQQPYTVPPCNVECYTDEKGDWVYIYIPAGYTTYYERKFRVPDYFLADQPIDVVLDIYEPNAQATNATIITAVYWHNVSYLSSEPSETQAMGIAMKNAVDGSVKVFAEGFGTDITGAKLLLWSILTVIVALVTTIIIRQWVVFIGVSIIMLTAGLVIGFVPAAVYIIMILLSAGVIIYFIRNMLIGG